MLSSVLRAVKLVALTLFAVAFISFAASNHEPASLSLFPLPYAVDLPLFLLVMFSIALGILMAFIVIGASNSRHRSRYIAEKKRAAALEAELTSLKALQSSKPGLPVNYETAHGPR